MKQKKVINRSAYDPSFQFEVLSSHYSSGESLSVTSFRYGINRGSLCRWKNLFENHPESLSLSEELLTKLRSMRKKRTEEDLKALTSAESLQAEISRLRKALEYSELRNEALSELLKIGREEYGIDLLKKVGAKQ
ncbi:hypothetical protein DWW10_06075 [Bacteroides intestinalis]|jgi:transposase-like protein|uniref:Transposase n=2 Tax=Bacteroides intestinalis TaxID=329854 RepID=A0A412YFY6_9BACE|nr:hypothetical protein [Bacteroides intestinalis]RGV56248.1 hypothetical protein DWW10_06075 [Bacteroides intestinalis]RHA61819.1 hypothetical protein DW932_06485 [Bacteroides intestinalis]